MSIETKLKGGIDRLRYFIESGKEQAYKIEDELRGEVKRIIPYLIRVGNAIDKPFSYIDNKLENIIEWRPHEISERDKREGNKAIQDQFNRAEEFLNNGKYERADASLNQVARIVKEFRLEFPSDYESLRKQVSEQGIEKELERAKEFLLKKSKSIPKSPMLYTQHPFLEVLNRVEAYSVNANLPVPNEYYSLRTSAYEKPITKILDRAEKFLDKGDYKRANESLSSINFLLPRNVSERIDRYDNLRNLSHQIEFGDKLDRAERSHNSGHDRVAQRLLNQISKLYTHANLEDMKRYDALK